MTERGKFIGPGEGTAHVVGGVRQTEKISSEDSGGTCAAYENAVAPGAGAGLHVHCNEDEIFFIVEGAFEFRIGTETVMAQLGSTLIAPRGVAHAFKNVGPSEGRIFHVVTPGGLEALAGEISAIMRSDKGNPARVQDKVASYGLKFFERW